VFYSFRGFLTELTFITTTNGVVNTTWHSCTLRVNVCLWPLLSLLNAETLQQSAITRVCPKHALKLGVPQGCVLRHCYLTLTLFHKEARFKFKALLGSKEHAEWTGQFVIWHALEIAFVALKYFAITVPQYMDIKVHFPQKQMYCLGW